MTLAYDYPLLNLFWTMVIIFVWIAWFWLLISVFADVFRRHDMGGGAKVLWLIFVIFVPFLGVFVYLIVNNKGMAERNAQRISAQQQQLDTAVRSAASSGPSAEIDKAKQLLDSGAITQSEFDTIKQKALA